ARLGAPQVLRYGDSAPETLDLYRAAGPGAPIHVFVHGGAWTRMSARDSAAAAPLFVGAGAHFAALDFALLPTVELGEMVAQVRRAVAWLYRHAVELGGNPARLHVSGHSSGAHLSALLCETDWPGEFGLPADVVKSALLVSGSYDLKPVRLSARSAYVTLTDATEHALSPQRHAARLGCPVIVAYAEHDTDEFRRHARDFHAAIAAAGHRAPLLRGDGVNHFEFIESLARPDGVLGRAALTQMGLA
ncbi:MAG: alpha/beta hydrolase, partial [Proteobacteria bacterium]|nr:alpha/beta hydrolase [Pseudomonadota bacterium]